MISLLTIIVLQTLFFYAKYESQSSWEFIVFSKKKTTIITERLGDKVTVNSKDSILKTTNDNLALKSYIVANFCKINIKKKVSNLYYFKKKKILVMDSSGIYLEEEKPDILILTHSPKVNLARLFSNWKPEQVVVDGTNFKTYIKIWKETCRKEKIPFHDTSEKGFYKL